MSDVRTIKYREFFRQTPTIASQLPIEFKAEEISWYGLTISCGTCNRELADKCTHGTVTSLIPSVITVECVSVCMDCLHLFHGIYRFRSDGAMEFQNSDGRWVRTYGRSVTWWSKLVDRLKRLKPLWENLI